jgi:hypothetical protein
MESEKELAAYYQAHRGDPEEWGELEEGPIERRVHRTGLSVSIAVRFSPEEAAAIRQTAKREGKTYSEVVRTAVHRYTQPDTVAGATNLTMPSALQPDTPRTARETAPATVTFDGKPPNSQALFSEGTSTAH